ncbi:hypothetical protein [Blastococcus capsensis]|nr:hypothetical protein [Blastococcus capsensis]MDK3256012.1 hypothetical protein [Blastococcus capsensis]
MGSATRPGRALLDRLAAGAFVATVVPVAVLLALRRRFVRDLRAGSVTG